MQFAGFVEVRELWFIGNGELRMLVDLVVQFGSVVGVREVLLGLLFYFLHGFDPGKQICSFFFILSGLVSLESFVVSFFFEGSLWFITR